MTKLQLEQYEKIAEAILFAGGEPVDQKVVAMAMEIDEDAAVAVLESLKTKYEKFEGSIEVRRLETQWQLCTKPEYESYIRGAFEIKRNAPLSQAALEVLAIIAYNQPVTRAFAEQVRGVDSSGVIQPLRKKDLLKKPEGSIFPENRLLTAQLRFSFVPSGLNLLKICRRLQMKRKPRKKFLPRNLRISSPFSTAKNNF